MWGSSSPTHHPPHVFRVGLLRDSSSTLVDPLNTLLDILGLPFVLDTPLDLTPSLLLAILESLLQSRLPISTSIRESRSDVAKVQAMKIFLGVLETDVLNEDVGLSDIDPRRLAAGEWEEVVFIAELLCWLGKQMGLLPTKNASSIKPPGRPLSTAGENTGPILETSHLAPPSARSTASNSIVSGYSFNKEYEESDTTVQSANSEVTEAPQPRSERMLPDPDHRHRHRPQPQCIHEIEDPSFLAQEDEDLSYAQARSFGCETSESDIVGASCDCSRVETASTSTTVRYDGYIQEVDADMELRTFEARKATRKRRQAQSEKVRKRTNPETPRMPPYLSGNHQITRITSPSQHALALLDERAKLLSRLANLDLYAQ
ncbi:hypothetical protein EDB85DRAFT_1857050 [Lactarius pseudohatsudake]|nr:hypothetical protein EDB85DRAFT_1857050 [Lactarius pseudohatsudake]